MITFYGISFPVGMLMGMPVYQGQVFIVARAEEGETELAVPEDWLPREVAGFTICRDDDRFWTGNCYGQVVGYDPATHNYQVSVKIAGAKRQ